MSKLSAEELDEALNQIAYGCREPEVQELGRVQDHIAALEREMGLCRDEVATLKEARGDV